MVAAPSLAEHEFTMLTRDTHPGGAEMIVVRVRELVVRVVVGRVVGGVVLVLEMIKPAEVDGTPQRRTPPSREQAE